MGIIENGKLSQDFAGRLRVAIPAKVGRKSNRRMGFYITTFGTTFGIADT